MLHVLSPASWVIFLLQGLLNSAHSFESITSYDTIIEASQLAEICRSGPGQPYVLGDLMIGPAQLPPGDDVRLFDGLGLQLHVPGLLDAADFEEDDAMTLMEFPESSLSSGSSRPSRRSSEPQLSCSSRICTFEGTTFDAELRRRNPDQFLAAPLQHLGP